MTTCELGITPSIDVKCGSDRSVEPTNRFWLGGRSGAGRHVSKGNEGWNERAQAHLDVVVRPAEAEQRVGRLQAQVRRLRQLGNCGARHGVASVHERAARGRARGARTLRERLLAVGVKDGELERRARVGHADGLDEGGRKVVRSALRAKPQQGRQAHLIRRARLRLARAFADTVEDCRAVGQPGEFAEGGGREHDGPRALRKNASL